MKTNNFSETEKKLLEELEYILVSHRYKCSSMEAINSSSSTYMYRIKKALLNSKVEQKRIAVLNTIINSVNNKIKKGMLFKEIFEPLPAIIVDELKKYSKSKQKSKDNKEKVKKTEPVKDDKSNKRQEKINFMNNKIDEILKLLEGYDKKELQAIESEYYDNIWKSTSEFGIKDANKAILGSLYCGMIENTRKNFKNFLYDNYRAVLKDNDRISDRMSIELLRYRVAALIYTNVMCSKRIKKINPNHSSTGDYKQYNGLKKDVLFLGNVVREKYINEYSISPKEELTANYIGGQIAFEELMPERNEIIRKRDFK